MDFLQKTLAWFSKFYLRVQSKNCGKKSLFCFFSRIFSNFEQKLFRLLAKKLQKDFKTTYVSRGNVCDLNFFSKVSNRFGFSAETFGMVLKIYLRVQSKNCGKNSFFLFPFKNFFDFWAKISQTFGKKNFQKMWKLLLRVHRNNLWLYNFLKSFEPFWIFYRNLWHGSQNSIYVSRVKIAGKIVCFCFLFRIFFEFWAKIFQTFGQKTSRSFQNYLLRVQRNSLWLEFFSKVLNRFAFSAETFVMVLKLLSTCPE